MREKLMTLSLAVLRDIAKDKNIKSITAMRKNELIEAIMQAGYKDGSIEPEENSGFAASTEVPLKDSNQPAGGGEVLANRQSQRSDNPDSAESAENRERQQAYERATVRDEGPAANGILEVMPDGYGFIRCENYLPGENDVYVSPSQIRRFNLKTGDIIVGPKRAKSSGEKFSALLHLESVNGIDPMINAQRPAFESLTPIFPNRRIHLEPDSKSISMRIVDLISPIGMGQRGMIVSQPKAGKTTLLKQIAKSITRNNPEMYLIILLIDERPEEVTDIKESIEGRHVDVIYSTFDELHMPKRFFGAARNMREGGSLTILATALVETGSKMDDVIFEEFKGTGNMELVLDRKLSERRIFPAIDIAKSSTRRDDLLLNPAEYQAMEIVRKALSGVRSDEAVERILDLFVKTRSNEEFVQRVKHNKIF